MSKQQIKIPQLTTLPFPNLTPNNLLHKIKRTTTYRKGGIRLQHEQIRSKHLFHNYGHGSSGIALAYGSAFISTKSLETYMDQSQQISCAVVGAGLIALFTAVQLSKKGYQVTLYSDKIPKYNSDPSCRQNSFSNGLYLPYKYDKNDNLKYELLCKISHDYYKSCMQSNRYQSIKTCTVYQKDSNADELKQKIPAFLNNYYRNELLSFGDEQQEYTRFKTIKIDVQFLKQELKVQASLRGVKFVERKFSNGDNIIGLNESAIFNCSGRSSGYLFGDKSMVEYADHMAIYKNESNLEYSMIVKISESYKMRLHYFLNYVIIENQQLSESVNVTLQQMIGAAAMFFRIKPKL